MKFANDVLGLTVYFEGPDTPEDYDRAIGSPNACLTSAVIRSAYHAWNPKFRPKLAKAVVEHTGVPIPLNPKSTKKVKQPDGSFKDEPQPLTEKDYIDLMLAEKKITNFDLQLLGNKAAEEVGPIKLEPDASNFPKALMEKAEGVVAGEAQGLFSKDVFIANFEAKNPGHKFQGDWNAVNIAKSIRINTNRVNAEKAASADPMGLE